MKLPNAFAKLPPLELVREYRSEWLKFDMTAGLSVAAVSLPSAIAYPAIAGLPIQTGLFAAVFSMLGYALTGPSRQLMIGPDTATCIMLASILGALSLPQIGDRVATAETLAVMVGMLCLVAGALRFGMLANFLSRPILVGFLVGISISLIIGQITRMTAVPIVSRGLFAPILEFASQADLIHLPTLLIGLGSLLGVRALQRVVPGLPAPLIVIVCAIAISTWFNLAQYQIAVIGNLPEIRFELTLPHMDLTHLFDLFGGALAIMIVGFGSGIVTARSFALKARVDVDADRELVGFGGANILSGLFGGFPVTASDSRTAVNFSIGGKTQLTSLIAAAGIALAVLFVSDLLAKLPTATLGAILVSAAIDLIDLKELRAIRRISPIEFVLSIVTLLGVVIVGVLQGVFIAIAVTLAQLLWTASRPRTALLGRLPGSTGLVKLHRYPNAVPIPGMTIVMIEAAVIFFNADYVKKRLRQIALARRETTAFLVMDASAVNIIDSSAVAKLDELREELAAAGIAFCISELNYRARQCVERSGLADRLGPGMVFASTDAAIDAFTGHKVAPTLPGSPTGG